MEEDKQKILIFDIETAPIFGAVWKLWETNVVWTEQDWYMLSFAWKWLGDKETHVLALPDFSGYKVGSENDKKLCQELWNLFNEADIIVAHNGDSFDVKKSNARFIIHGFKPYSPILQVDTKKIAKNIAGFSSNSLNNLGDYLGCGTKLNTGGSSLWRGCISGETNSWTLMKKYNKQDVILLEEIYLRLRPWAKSHPSIARLDKISCTRCSSTKVQSRGYGRTATGITFNRYCCMSCGRWSQERVSDKIKTVLR